MSEDHSLSAPQDAPAFADPAEKLPVLQMSVEEVLECVRRPERTATLYLRGDLLAERDELRPQLALLVDARGEVIEDGEGALGEESNAARAQRLATRLREVETQLAKSAWHVRFRGMPSDEWAAFTKAHLPKTKGSEKPDVDDFNNLLIAETAIAPTITVDQMKKLRKKFGAKQVTELANKAWEACNDGGVDAPKSPSSWLNLAQQ